MSNLLMKALIILGAVTSSSFAAELVCVSLKGNDEFFINTNSNEIVRHGKMQKIEVITSNSHYGFSGENWYCLKGGCQSKFTASINRSTGLATTDNRWGYFGGIDEHFIGICKPAATPKM